VFDQECRYMRVNAAAAEINGLPPEAHIGKTVDEVLPHLESQSPVFRRVLRGETVPDMEVTGATPARPGIQRWWLASYYPIRHGDDTDGICVLFREITEWKRAQSEREALLADLQKASAAKDEFLGLVSHELKTPITTIVGNAQVLRAKSAAISAEDRESALDDIAHEGQRLHTIIDNMLILSRLEKGQHVEIEPVIVRRLIDDAVDQHRKLFPRREIAVREDRRDLALGEPTYVTQIAGNLLSNAEKYSPSGATIDVVVDRSDGFVNVHVLDRGSGFPEAEAEQLFTPFYRSPRTSAMVKGVGVGLSVCKRLVEAQDGYMWAQQREGGGADIGFALPAIDEE
jgi:PAS domain S-box-containing protein